MKIAAYATLILFSLSSCMNLKHYHDDAKNSEATLKAKLGLTAKVTFRASSGPNGQRTVVTVHLSEPPQGDSSTIKSQITDVVVHTFHAHVDQVTVEF